MDVHDVVLLKTYSLPSGVRDIRDAMTLLVLNACCPEKCPEWQNYFIEMMASFIVKVLEPQNGIDHNKLQWITEMFTTDGVANSPIESELLQHVMDLLAHPSIERPTKTPTPCALDNATLAVSTLRSLAEQLTPPQTAHIS
ncbi:hypothetical protein [Rhizobium sp.]|uniref:hypothetical protein n=1 Tax=Rhizobium sp. TaxID=391 RepID=UPI000E8BFD08|nr:hypothetical protein [Rhizobium sp.]